MDFRRGEGDPIVTGLPNKRKSVKTIGGTYEESTTLSGKNEVTPLKPPKNISPLELWKQAAPPVKFGPGSPSAVEKVAKVSSLGSNRATPLLVLIHSLRALSSKMQSTVSPGRPACCV